MLKDFPGNLASALTAGGDSRLDIGGLSGLNKYLCPALPDPGIVCASSCTASPIEQNSFDAAAACFDALSGAASVRSRSMLLSEQTRRVERYLLRYFQADGLADAMLCPSGTDAVLTAAGLLAAERGGAPLTAILPSASETGTGVPLAASGRLFDGPCQGQIITPAEIGTLEVALRGPDGSPLPDDAVDAAYASAVSAASGRAVVYLTYGTKTGLIAPHDPPAGAEVIVDACQARIDPARVAAYLRRGWPVVVTGSKFFGGPAFSGAVLFPVARRIAGLNRNVPGMGTVLRWIAAVEAMERFSGAAEDAAKFLDRRIAAVEHEIMANPALVPIGGLARNGPHWADRPSIVTFAVRDARKAGRLLPVKDLKLIHERLAHGGVLLGQPVSLGAFGGLRVAIGARDVVHGAIDEADRLLEAIRGLRNEPAAGLAVAAE
nr:hypothetical protein [uncultured Rhodopila sp.]